jgi:branched-chain amino acid transport system ATP-binding protein
MSPLLEVRSVSKRFFGLAAVNRVSLEVQAQEIVAVIGPNGAGKTTLFNMIAGTLTPDQGTITFAGERVEGKRPDQMARRGLGRTFQIARPFPQATVEENVIIGGLLHHTRLAGAIANAQQVMRQLDLWGKRAQLASSLTLPDRKRLELARALAMRPKLLLLDEVMAGLRPTETDTMVAILRDLNRHSGLTVLLIEHVMRAVVALASRIVVLHHGAAIAGGAPATVVRDPAVLECYLGVEDL